MKSMIPKHRRLYINKVNYERSKETNVENTQKLLSKRMGCLTPEHQSLLFLKIEFDNL